MASQRNLNKLPIFAAGTSGRIVGWWKPAKAARWEALGLARREYDATTGKLIGYRELSGAELKNESLQPLMEMPALMDADQMELNLGRSATRGLSEQRRVDRVGVTGCLEDRIERVQAKVRVYQNVGAARGDILRAWPLMA
jgi:hypothetical protein